MTKNTSSKKVLKAIARALKTGLPISALALGLNGCKDNKPLGIRPGDTVVGKYTSIEQVEQEEKPAAQETAQEQEIDKK